MKKYIFLIFILILTVSCSKKSEKTVDMFLSNIKNLNLDEAKKYIENEDILNKINFEKDNEIKNIFFEKVFENFEYEILNVTLREDGNEVVNVKIKNIDIEELLDKTFKEIFRKNILGLDNLNLEAQFKEILKKEQLPLKTNLSQFLITKNKKILLRNENIKYIFGGYF